MKIKVNWDWISMAATMVVILPILIYASKSLPAVDDFAAAALIAPADSEWSRIVLVVKTVYQSYFLRGGIWFSSIIAGIFEPYSRAGMQGLRIFNTLAVGFFFASLFWFIRVFCKKLLQIEKHVVWPLYFLVVFMVVNGYQNHDVWTWYTGVTSYLVPVSIMFCVFILFILAVHRNNNLYLIPAVGAFCVGGTSLNIAALNCGFLMLLGIYAYIALGKKKESIVVFFSAFGGALFNTVAPGNWVRHSTMPGDSSVIVALKDAVLFSLKLLGDRISFSPFLAILLLIFFGACLCVDYKSINMKFKHPWISLGVVLLGLVVVNFPVCLGYASRTPHPRCVFVNDIALYLLSLLWVVYYAGYRIKCSQEAFTINGKRSGILISILLVAATGLMWTHGGMERFTTGYMVRSILDGSFDEYIRQYEGIFSEIESSADTTVVVVRDHEKKNLIMKPIGITTNPGEMGNWFMARFFGKKSVSIKYLK